MSMGKRKCFNGDKFFSVCPKCVKQIYMSGVFFTAGIHFMGSRVDIYI